MVEFVRMGKRKFGGSDSDDTDEEGSDDTEEREKSVVLNNGNHSDSSKEADGSSGSVTGGKQDEFSGGASSESGSEEEKEIVLQGIVESGGCERRESLHADVVEPVIDEKMAQSTSVPLVSETEALLAEKQGCIGLEIANLEEATGQPPNVLIAGNGEGLDSAPVDCEANTLDFKSRVCEETPASTNTAEMETPLNFDGFNSVAEMEVCY
jgi:hypothetical protein